MEGDKSMEVKYYICKHCGNIVEKVKDKGVPVICCGEPMQELKAGVTDAAVEKHVPVYTVEGNYLMAHMRRFGSAVIRKVMNPVF